MSSLIARAYGRWSDIVGFVFFASMAAALLARLPELGLLLLPSIGKEVFTAYTFLRRDRARAAVGTIPARFAAYAGSFVMIGALHALKTWRPEALALTPVREMVAVGAVIWLAGTTLVVVSIWTLRYAFSIEPEARRLVRNGPYQFVRHPVYAGYVLQYLGFLIIAPSAALALALLVWFALTLVRMTYEEQVLAATFDEYATYRETTGALAPLPRVKARWPPAKSPNWVALDTAGSRTNR